MAKKITNVKKKTTNVKKKTTDVKKKTGKTSARAGNQDYKTFGGWLLAIYWCEIIGGILSIIMALTGFLSVLAASSTYVVFGVRYGGIGTAYIISLLISLASSVAATVFYIRSAFQMKARDSRFFDTIVMGMLISFGGSIVSSLFTGIGSFIGSIIWGVIGFAIGLGITIMYFQRSVRVKVYFSGRPLHDSRYWDKIENLPDFIISEKPLFGKPGRR